MKVLLVGQFTGYHSENFILDALKQLDIDTHIVNTNDYVKISLLNRVMYKFKRVPHYFGVRTLNEELLKKAQQLKPDFILFIKPIYITPETVVGLKKISKLYSWHADHVDFPKNFSDYFYKAIPLYDCHFSANIDNTGAMLRYGAKRSINLPITVNKDCFQQAQITEEDRRCFGSDIVFVGNYAKEMRAEYCEKLCKDGYDIKVYGFGWEKLGRRSCLIKSKRIEPKELGCEGMPKVFQASKIALAFVREHNNEQSGLRSYEIPICEGFMLHVRTKFISEFYEEGKEAEFFSSYEEMKIKIDKYLSDNESRKRIALAGYKRIIESNFFIIDHVKKLLDMHVRNEC